MSCEFINQSSLTEDLLWQVAEGLFWEAICLDILSDFRATSELASMQNEVMEI